LEAGRTNFRVELITTTDRLREISPEWQLLTSKLKFKRHVHLVEWHLALAETIEKHNLPPITCLAVFSDTDLIALFPWRKIRVQLGSFQFNALQLSSDIGNNNTIRDIVLEPTLVETTFLKGMILKLAEYDSSWDAIAFPGILDGSLAATALKGNLQLPHLQLPGGAWGHIESIPCGDDDRPFDQLSKGFRQNLRTAHNKLKNHRVNFQITRTPADLVECLPIFLTIESSGWKGAEGTSALKDAAVATFLDRLVYNFSPIGGCEICVMRVDNQPIASLFGLLIDKVWFILRTGYDENYGRLSPGHLILENLLLKQKNGSRFNVITPYNAPPWFGAWKPKKTPVFDSYVFRPSRAGLDLGKKVVEGLR